MKTPLLIVAIATVLYSCTSPMERKYNERSYHSDIEVLKEHLDPGEFMILAGTLVRLKMEDGPLETMTYAEILQNGKKWKRQQQAKRKREMGIHIDRRISDLSN